MNRKTKNAFITVVIVLICLLGIPIGRLIQVNLKSFGVTFITMTDIIGCYSIPIAILFFVGIFVGIKLEEAIPDKK